MDKARPLWTDDLPQAYLTVRRECEALKKALRNIRDTPWQGDCGYLKRMAAEALKDSP